MSGIRAKMVSTNISNQGVELAIGAPDNVEGQLFDITYFSSIFKKSKIVGE